MAAAAAVAGRRTRCGAWLCIPAQQPGGEHAPPSSTTHDGPDYADAVRYMAAHARRGGSGGSNGGSNGGSGGALLRHSSLTRLSSARSTRDAHPDTNSSSSPVNVTGTVTIHNESALAEPAHSRSSGACGDECVVCLEHSPDTSLSHCIHSFHMRCILAWARNCNVCPVCKRRFTSVARLQLADSVPSSIVAQAAGSGQCMPPSIQILRPTPVVAVLSPSASPVTQGHAFALGHATGSPSLRVDSIASSSPRASPASSTLCMAASSITTPTPARTARSSMQSQEPHARAVSLSQSDSRAVTPVNAAPANHVRSFPPGSGSPTPSPTGHSPTTQHTIYALVLEEEHVSDRDQEPVDLTAEELAALGYTQEELECECYVCHSAEDEANLLLCDSHCGRAAHTWCAGLREVPAGNWYCRWCQPSGPRPRGRPPRPRTTADASAVSLATEGTIETSDAHVARTHRVSRRRGRVALSDSSDSESVDREAAASQRPEREEGIVTRSASRAATRLSVYRAKSPKADEDDDSLDIRIAALRAVSAPTVRCSIPRRAPRTPRAVVPSVGDDAATASGEAARLPQTATPPLLTDVRGSREEPCNSHADATLSDSREHEPHAQSRVGDAPPSSAPLHARTRANARVRISFGARSVLDRLLAQPASRANAFTPHQPASSAPTPAPIHPSLTPSTGLGHKRRRVDGMMDAALSPATFQARVAHSGGDADGEAESQQRRLRAEMMRERAMAAENVTPQAQQVLAALRAAAATAAAATTTTTTLTPAVVLQPAASRTPSSGSDGLRGSPPTAAPLMSRTSITSLTSLSGGAAPQALPVRSTSPVSRMTSVLTLDAHCSNWNPHAGGEGGDASAEEAKKDGGVGSVTLRGVEDGEEHSLASPATVLSLDLVTEYVKSKLMPLFRAQQLSREEYKNVAKLSVKRAAAYLSTKLRVRVERQDVSTAHAAAQLDKPMKKLILKAVHSELVTVAGERVAAGVLGSDA